MRVSFDLDDTIFIRQSQPSDGRLLTGDRLRSGAARLMRELAMTHELWIYTTSFRSPILLKLAFRMRGIRIRRIVNESVHQRVMQGYDFLPVPSKYPPHFEIDLHIDDSEGVVVEGERWGFDVLRVEPEDRSWTEKIRQRLEPASLIPRKSGAL